jgi:hypothetical protein
MKNVTAREGSQVFQKFFTDLVKFQAPLVVWQLSANGQRIIHSSQIKEIVVDEGFFQVSSIQEIDYQFASGNLLYCYSEKSGAIFKSRALALSGDLAQLKLPDELLFLDESDIIRIKGAVGIDLSDAPWKVKRLGRSERDEAIFNEQLDSISLSEEEKLFADKREAPRAKPKVDKIVTCQLAQQPQTSQNFKLFDLSRGGLGLLILIEDTFKKGQHVEVTAMEGQDLDEPFIGEVMSVRSLAPEDVGWKVGIKFVYEVPRGEES